MKLFEPGKIGTLTLKNRIIMAPMGTRFEALDGGVSPRDIDYWVARAKGGVGMVMTGGFRVYRKAGVKGVAQAHMADDNMYVARINELVEALHDHGVKLSVQLHTGMGRTSGAGIGDKEIVAPLAVPVFDHPEIITREMTVDEIERIIKAYEFAGKVMRNAGVDCMDIHAHKGGFVDQFMTALWNKRTDDYGGSLEKRLRFPIEILKAAKLGGGGMPVTFRYGLTHYLPGGRDIEEGLEVARRMEAAGADALLIDAGCEETIYWIHPPTTQPPGCMVDLAEKVKNVVKIPVMAVGKLGYPELAEKVLQEGKADFIVLGRALLADPEWANKVRAGRFDDICPCIGDHEGCEGRTIKHRFLSCTVNPAAGFEHEMVITPAEVKKKVLVVGGGPGGMEAARVSALRGHQVTLWEKAKELGGNLIPASAPDFKQDYRRLLDYQKAQVRKLGVTVALGKEATLATIKAVRPDVVYIATGAKPCMPEIPGLKSANTMTAIDLLRGKKQAGESVVVLGGGVAGCEAALYLARQGKKVTIVEILDGLSRTSYRDNREHMELLLHEAGVDVLCETRLLSVSGPGLALADKSGSGRSLWADSIVIAVGMKSEDRLSAALAGAVPEVYPIGDCVEPRKVINAIWEAYRIARKV